MTDIQKLRDDVISAVLAAPVGPDGVTPMWTCRLDAARSALRAAEEAERKPRLRTAREASLDCLEHEDTTAEVKKAIRARDAEWMEAIRKLLRWRRYFQEDDARGGKVTITGEDAILLSDIEALAETGKG